MNAPSLVLLFALSALGTQPRNAPRPGAPPATAASQDLTDAEIAARVSTYLGVIDTPITVQQWQTLGARAVGPLQAALDDPHALPSRRAKAIDALSAIGGTTATRLVLQHATSEKEPFVVRASAVRGAARVLGASELAKALQPVLVSAGSAPVRAAAAEVLATRAPGSACSAIRAQANREAERDRGQFARALEACGR